MCRFACWSRLWCLHPIGARTSTADQWSGLKLVERQRNETAVTD